MQQIRNVCLYIKDELENEFPKNDCLYFGSKIT